MRTIFSSLILFCTALAIAQEPYLPYKTLKHNDDLEFPVFTSKNPVAAQNINRLLQLSELYIIDSYYKENIFENVMPDEDGVGSYDINFEIKENSPRLLSVRFNLSACGATCGYWTNCYNFNPQTGEPIQLGDLLTADGLERFNSILATRWAAQIDAGLEDDPAEDKEICQEFKQCFDEGYTQLDSFYVEGNSLFVDAENCLHKNAKFYDIDTQVRFSIKEITPFLSDYGKAVLGISGKAVGNFKSEYLLKELQVYSNKEKDIIMGLLLTERYISGYYANKKEGIYTTVEALSADNTLLLKADTDTIGTINATIKGNQVTLRYGSAGSSDVIILTKE